MTQPDGAAPPVKRDSATEPGAAVGTSSSREMSPPANPSSHGLVKVLSGIATTGLLAITIAPSGATRMYATPWTIALYLALSAAAAVLLLRAFDRQQPIALPSTGWQVAAVGGAVILLISALVSPYRSDAVLWAAPELAAIGSFFVFFDWLNRVPSDAARRRVRFRVGLIGLFLVIAVAGLTEWIVRLRSWDSHRIFFGRNAYPLGHSNYTAGLALLMLPAFVAGFARRRGYVRWLAGLGNVLALAMLFTSGSRGGMIGLAAVALLGLIAAPLSNVTKSWLALGAVLFAFGFVAANPRTRTMLLTTRHDEAPNMSNVERTAMLEGGLRMGITRPLLGWGPGTTPLAYPRYRELLDGGAEDVLQLHSLPVQLWAELGLCGVMTAAFVGFLLVRDCQRDPIAAVTLGGYAVFALFDFQLDVPIFGFVLAALAALLAAPKGHDPNRHAARRFGLFVATVLAIVLGLGRRDSAPLLNVAALGEQAGRQQPSKAVELLEQSLAINPDQEIAHFNLGWLLVVEDPKQATIHFLSAAHLVPDKGGVYFGLALASLNAGDEAGAARALALELLNDPVFQLSPWWKNPRLAALRQPTRAALAADIAVLLPVLPPTKWAGRELRYFRSLEAWIAEAADAKEVADAADTPERHDWFLHRPDRNLVAKIPSRTMAHQRVGYPVLMRNLDLTPPIDLWAVQESAARSSQLAYLWPEKGWLPSPLVIALLDRRDLPRK